MQNQPKVIAGGAILAISLAIYLFDSNSRNTHAVTGSEGTVEHTSEVGALVNLAQSGSERLKLREDLNGLESTAASIGTEAVPMAEVSIVVVNDDGHCIEGVELYDTDQRRRLGASDSQGELLVQVGLGAEFDLLVSHSQFVSRFGHVLAEPGEEILLQMMPAWELEGVVLAPGGNPVGAGVNVFAVDPFQSLRTLAVAATARGIPSIQRAETDSDGRFTLHSLNHEIGYKLFVGGKGCVSFQAMGGHQRYSSKTVQPVLIATQAAYAVRVLLVDEEGGPLRIGEEFFGPWVGSLTPATEGVYRIPIAANAEILLGLDNAGAKEPHEQVLMFGSYSELNYLELEYSVNVPGYSPLSGVMRCPRAQGELATVELELSASELRRGELLVSCSSDQDLEELVGPGGLQLTLEDQVTGSVVVCDLVEFVNGAYVVSGIPFGTYIGGVEYSIQSYVVHLAESIQVSEVPSEIALPVDFRGALDIAVQTGSGASFSGPIRGSLTFISDGDTLFFDFARPPLSHSVAPSRSMGAVRPDASAYCDPGARW